MILKIIFTILNILFIFKCVDKYNQKSEEAYGLLCWVFTEIIILIWVML